MLLVTVKATQLLLKSSSHLLGHSKLVTLLVEYVLQSEPDLANGCHRNEVILAAFLHDIGKIYWPKEFFESPQYSLSQSDRFLMASHPINGANLARQLGASENTAQLIEQHHEKLGGCGYPQKLNNPNPAALVIGTCNAYVNRMESGNFDKSARAKALKDAEGFGCHKTINVLKRLTPERICTSCEGVLLS